MADTGRLGVGRAQGLVAPDYPLVGPVEDVIAGLLADFYLAYDDPSDYAEGGERTYPFRISWLYGLGTESTSYSDVPSATHAADIEIVDADDITVFDSTAANYAAQDWGTDYRIHRWWTATANCWLVQYLTWPTDGSPEARTYDDHIVPENAVLDPATIFRQPRRIRKITVGASQITSGAVQFAAGYNVQLTPGTETYGLRPSTTLMVGTVPGAGLGKYNDCTETDRDIWTINGVGPNERGQFFIKATDCYFVRRPLAVTSGVARPTALIAPWNATSPAWPAEKSAAHLFLGNNCTPCCDCDDFVTTAQYLLTVQAEFKSVGSDAETIRDNYHALRLSYLTQKACRENRPLRVAMQPQLCPQLDVVLQYCNTSDTCQDDVALAVTFSESHGGVGSVIDYYTTLTGGITTTSRPRPRTRRHTVSGTWPNYTVTVGKVDPGRSAYVKFRLEFDNCGEDTGAPYEVTATLTGTIGGSPITVDGSPYSAVETTELDCPAPPGAIRPINTCLT